MRGCVPDWEAEFEHVHEGGVMEEVGPVTPLCNWGPRQSGLLGT